MGTQANVLTPQQMRCIYALARGGGISNEDLHAVVFATTGKDSMKLLTTADAKQVIDRLKRLTGQETTAPHNRPTKEQVAKIYALAAKLGTPCRILPADLAKEEDCQRLFKELEGETIDIFINNAGFGVCGSYLETDDAREEEMIRVNVEAMARLFRFAVRRMHAAGGGTILNVASSAGLLPGGPYMAGYYASKAYVVSLTRGVARELQELHSPVYVCALCPGPVDTEFNDRAGVVFALKGITPEFCVQEAMHGMMHRRTIIVPSAFMRACTTAQKLLPASLLMPIVARQQKKKLG